MSAQNTNTRGQNPRSNDENHPLRGDKYAAVRDPGATPRRNLKNDKVAVVHSSDLDSEPNTEMYEAYENDEADPEESQSESINSRKNASARDEGEEQPHGAIP